MNRSISGSTWRFFVLNKLLGGKNQLPGLDGSPGYFVVVGGGALGFLGGGECLPMMWKIYV